MQRLQSIEEEESDNDRLKVLLEMEYKIKNERNEMKRKLSPIASAYSYAKY
jgi:hypothetical protein